MKIDAIAIKHLEMLARIELAPEERERLAAQVGRIVEYCEQLQELDTSSVEPTSAVVHEGQETLRADEPRPGLDRDVILGAAPDPQPPFFRVPKIIER